MKIKQNISILLIFLSVSVVKAQQLESLVGFVLKHNPEIKAFEESISIETSKNTIIKSWPDPSVSVGVFVSPVETRVGAQEARFSLQQSVPWFGSLKARSDEQKMISASIQEQIAELKLRLRLQVVSAVIEIYKLSEQQQLAVLFEQNLADIKTLFETQYAQDKAKASDLVEIEIAIAQNRLLQQSYDRKIEQQWNIIEQLAGKPVKDKLINNDEIEVLHLTSKNGDSILQTHPRLQYYESLSQSFNHKEVVIAKDNKPKFSVGLDYIIVSERSGVELSDNGKDAFMPMLSMTLPIFGKKNKAKIESVQAERKRVEQLKTQESNKLQTELKNLYIEIEDLQAKLNLLQQTQEDLLLIKDLSRSQFTQGIGTLTDVLENELKILNVKQEVISVNAQYIKTIESIKYYTHF